MPQPEPATVRAVAAPPGLEEVIAALRDAAASAGVDAYLVGGVVRDRLLGRLPAGPFELDLVTTGGGRGGLGLLRHLATALGWGAPQLFERFGTGQVRGDGWVVEMVQARAERYDPDSRKPQVRPGTLVEDVWRRDFTVNALCQGLDGHVLDLCGRGLDDLRAGVLRTPLAPRQTFAEDPLRMLRAGRFAAQLGFTAAPGLLEAMRASAPRARILSAERVRDELRRLLLAPRPRAGMELLREGGLVDEIMPELAATIGVEQSGHHIYDVWEHTMVALEAAPPDLVTRLAVLLHDVGKPPCHALDGRGRHTFHDHPAVGARIAEEMLSRLRFSNHEVAAVRLLVGLHLRPIQYDATSFGDSAVRRLVRAAGPLRDRLLDVARADTAASAFPTTAGIDELGERMARLDAGGAVSRRRPPLGGDELLELAGRGPGPWVGRVLRRLDEEVLEGRIPPDDANAARAWLRDHPEVLAEG